MNKPVSGFSAAWLGRRLKEILPEFPALPICVAFSGGMDSTVLLAALAERKSLKSRLRAVHINHRLSPNAKHWVAHCREFAGRLAVPLTVLTAKVSRARGTSMEAEARKARYELLTSELGAGELLLTAHHEDDQLETVLLQLLRGAGVAGLAAMPDASVFGGGVLARPLLPISRSTLQSWARAHELTWIEDETNNDERFDRNYLRTQVLPALKLRWPSAARAASRSARHTAEAQRLLNSLAQSDLERAAVGPSLSAKTLRTFSTDRRRNALRFWISLQGARLPNTARLEELAGPFLHARPDATPQVFWPQTLVERRDDLVTLTKTKK